MDMAPALEDQALRVVAQEEIILERLVGDVGDIGRPGDMRIAAVAEFELGALFLALGAVNEKHGSLLSRTGRPFRAAGRAG